MRIGAICCLLNDWSVWSPVPEAAAAAAEAAADDEADEARAAFVASVV